MERDFIWTARHSWRTIEEKQFAQNKLKHTDLAIQGFPEDLNCTNPLFANLKALYPNKIRSSNHDNVSNPDLVSE